MNFAGYWGKERINDFRETSDSEGPSIPGGFQFCQGGGGGIAMVCSLPGRGLGEEAREEVRAVGRLRACEEPFFF